MTSNRGSLASSIDCITPAFLMAHPEAIWLFPYDVAHWAGEHTEPEPRCHKCQVAMPNPQLSLEVS